MGKQTWSEHEKNKLIELYPTHADKELCEILGKRYTQLRSMKERLGLRAKWKGKAENLVGLSFGQLTVVSEAEKTNGSSNTRWSCRCNNCGSTVSVTDYLIKHSDPSSHCKCTRKKMNGQSNPSYRHGGSGSKLYSIWNGMKTRTNNPNSWNYKYYGGRGITICDEWSDFSRFQEWALKSGYIDGLSIDRIDNNKGYSPDNCRWVEACEQQGNRRPFNPHVTKST